MAETSEDTVARELALTARLRDTLGKGAPTKRRPPRGPITTPEGTVSRPKSKPGRRHPKDADAEAS